MNISILHYSVYPVVGGVEAVIQAHAELLLEAGHSVRVIAGVGEQSALPHGAQFTCIPEMNSLHPHVVELTRQLEAGQVPQDFESLSASLQRTLSAALEGADAVIVHNILSKHFNLPLTATLMRMLDQQKLTHCIAWCHDFSWTSSHSRPKLHAGYPWDLLKTYRDDLIYVTVSKHRQHELAELLGCAPGQIRVVYSGVDPQQIFSLTSDGQRLAASLDLDGADLILLMPVRITQAKNIELALKVTASLKSRGIRPKLVITGPPDPHDPTDMQYYQDLRDLRHQLGVEQEARFVYEYGPRAGEGYTIPLPMVSQLYRLCDALLIPSHREGFGMPILEAGLVGMPIFTTHIPAAEEIGGREVVSFSADDPPDKIAGLILGWMKTSPIQKLRQRVRLSFTWQAIFQRDIIPLLESQEAE